MPALAPEPEQAAAFAADNYDGPIVMVNLLKFRDKATYAEDDPEHGEDISGAEAYSRYGAALADFVSEEKIGLTQLFGAPAIRMMIGDADWDAVILARYPSRKHMMTMTSDPRYQAAHRHRAAGLLHQDLIETRPEE